MLLTAENLVQLINLYFDSHLQQLHVYKPGHTAQTAPSSSAACPPCSPLQASARHDMGTGVIGDNSTDPSFRGKKWLSFHWCMLHRR